MAIERTLSIVKPDAVGKNIIGKIYSRFESNGLQIVASKMLRLSDDVAGGFYAELEESQRNKLHARDELRPSAELGGEVAG